MLRAGAATLAGGVDDLEDPGVEQVMAVGAEVIASLLADGPVHVRSANEGDDPPTKETPRPGR